jgi:SsrA-binding protein
MKILNNNKKVFHNFFVSDFVEAGIALVGCEVKSVRSGGISLEESYVVIKNGEAILKNCYIKPYDKTRPESSDTRRSRKLLLHKVEISKLERMVREKGFSVMPTKVYIKDGKVKIEIALAKGKKLYDKRQVLREKAIKRDIDQTLKNL